MEQDCYFSEVERSKSVIQSAVDRLHEGNVVIVCSHYALNCLH